MEKYIKKIERTSNDSIAQLTGILLKTSAISALYGSKNVNGGGIPIELIHLLDLNQAVMIKLNSLGVSDDTILSWLNAFNARIKEFDFFKEQICLQIASGTISGTSLAKLFSSDPAVFDSELNRIMEVNYDVEWSLGNFVRHDSCLPLFGLTEKPSQLLLENHQ